MFPMNLVSLMEKLQHYNELATLLGNKKVYARFDGFERFKTKFEAIDYIERNYLNRVEILSSPMVQGDKTNEFTIDDEGFTYEVVVFNEH